MLGTLDHDVKGIEIVHYNAPIVIVKVETKDKKPVPGLKVSAHYTQPEKEAVMGKLILAGGVESDVNFEKQEDGRFRSEQLQPDLEFNVTAEADGFKPASRKLTHRRRERPRRSLWCSSRNERAAQAESAAREFVVAFRSAKGSSFAERKAT